MFQLEKKVRRFDVACAIEKAFVQNEWKGDPHNKGVFFTSQKAYCINKILAISIGHDEDTTDLYYAFDCDCIDDKVKKVFPFQEMFMKPKKHHLLFEGECIEKDNLDELFAISDCEKFIFHHKELLDSLSWKLPNKRERDRTQLVITCGDTISYSVERTRKNVTKCIFSGNIQTPTSFKEMRKFKMNAGTIHTILQLFDKKSEVCFELAHDRIKITGELSTLEGKQTEVCAVLALLKG